MGLETIVPIGIIFGIVLSLIDFFTEGKFTQVKSGYVSYATGVAAAYLFLWLFPSIYSGIKPETADLMLGAILLGFVIHHFIERYTFKHVSKGQMGKDVSLEHAIFTFVYHFIIGIVLINIFTSGFLQGLLYFIPIALYISIDNLPRRKIFDSTIVRLFFSAATLLGAVFGYYVQETALVSNVLLGFIVGILMYFFSREAFPGQKQGSNLLLLLGIIIYAAAIILSKTLL